MNRPAQALAAALLGGPFVLAFASGGYFEGPRLVAGIVAWALAAGLALVGPRPLPRSRPAAGALAALAGLTAWTALARGWAPLAGPAGDALQRDVLYLGALLAAVLVLRGRRGLRLAEAAAAAGAFVVVGYGVAGRLAPGVVRLAHGAAAGGRLDQPLTYWNAMGALGALGIVLSARLAGDPERPNLARVAAAAAGVPLGLGTYLTFSRGAIAALAAGLVVLLLLAPTWAQLRAAAIVLEGGALAALVGGRLDGVTSLAGSATHREAQGVLLLGVVAAAMVLCGALQAWSARSEADGSARSGALPLGRHARLAGWLLALAVAAAPYAAAVQQRGEAVNPAFGATTQRLSSVGSHRYAYWRVALRTWREHPLRGAGPGAFRVAWLRHRPFAESVRDAHSLELQTLAELGLLGLALLGGVAGAVVAALRRARRVVPGAVAGPAAALAVWAVHAGIDWDWELPALTLVAVLLAGAALGGGGDEPAA